MSVWRRILLAGVLMGAGSVSSAMAEGLTWQDCLKEAAGNHPDLIAAQEGVVQGQAAKAIVSSSALPQVTANLNAATSRTGTSGSSNSFDYGISGTQLVFDGFKTINNIKSAAESIKAARESFKFTSTTVRFRLRTAFVDLLKAQELVKLTQEIYDIRKRDLDLITLRYRSGTEHKGALLTAQANLSQASFEINQAKRGLETAQVQLSKEMGRKEFLPITVTSGLAVSDAVLQKPDLEAIAQNNPAILKINAQVNAASFDVNASQGDFWPVLSLTGGISKTGSSWPPAQKDTTGGVRVSLPLFEGGARFAQVARSKSIYRQLQEEERSIKDGIVLALEQTWNGLQDAVESVQVQNDFLNAAAERAKIAEQQYSVGLITYDNWTIIEDDLVSSKKTFLNTQTNALLAEANWIQAKGETLENEN